jgi:hypothetical protein
VLIVAGKKVPSTGRSMALTSSKIFLTGPQKNKVIHIFCRKMAFNRLSPIAKKA